jgi:hypothetical protein
MNATTAAASSFGEMATLRETYFGQKMPGTS